MPLPVENVDWPPKDIVDALKVIAEWDLWYGGDPEQIAHYYQDTDHSGPAGARGWSFWARRRPSTGANARRERLHVPVAGDIATTSADLLFANQVSLEVPGIRQDPENSQKAPTQDRIDTIIDRTALFNRLIEAAEECAADGGVYLRPTWDQAIPYPVLTHITPAQAVPRFRFGVLTEVTFWKTLTEEGEKVVLRHLEHHSTTPAGTPVIEHGLYRGTEDKVGDRIDLGAHPWTANLPEYTEIPGVKGLAVRYVPNMRPARRLRGSSHGRSDFDGVEGLFDAIDEAWNSWMRDLRLGKSRLVVPQDYLERRKGSPAFFDVDQELFTGLDMDPTQAEGAGIEQVQFKIRYEEHRATVEALVIETVGKAGYSPQSFGFHGDREQTATEVEARESRSERTTGKKRRYWETAVEDVFEVMLAVDRHILRTTTTNVVRPELEWPPMDAPDSHRIAETVDLLARAEAASIETLVRMQHPDWSDVDVLAEVDKIVASRPAPLPNPFDQGDEEIPDDEDEPE